MRYEFKETLSFMNTILNPKEIYTEFVWGNDNMAEIIMDIFGAVIFWIIALIFFPLVIIVSILYGIKI